MACFRPLFVLSFFGTKYTDPTRIARLKIGSSTEPNWMPNQTGGNRPGKKSNYGHGLWNFVCQIPWPALKNEIPAFYDCSAPNRCEPARPSISQTSTFYQFYRNKRLGRSGPWHTTPNHPRPKNSRIINRDCLRTQHYCYRSRRAWFRDDRCAVMWFTQCVSSGRARVLILLRVNVCGNGGASQRMWPLKSANMPFSGTPVSSLLPL